MENLGINNNEINPLKDVLFVVLLCKNENFGVIAPYDTMVLGKKMWKWVALSGNGARIESTLFSEELNVLSLVKPFVGKEKYTMVFYSDTPNLSRETVIEILEYFKQKGLNVLKLKRGFVFNSEYLLSCDSVLAPVNELFNSPEFEPVENMEDLSKFCETLRQNILKFHMKNGVFVVDPKTTFIDADVVIEKGTKIEPNNVLQGKSYVGEGCVLEPNNIIKDSIISNNVVVKNSYVANSKISENKIIGPYGVIIDKIV